MCAMRCHFEELSKAGVTLHCFLFTPLCVMPAHGVLHCKCVMNLLYVMEMCRSNIVLLSFVSFLVIQTGFAFKHRVIVFCLLPGDSNWLCRYQAYFKSFIIYPCSLSASVLQFNYIRSLYYAKRVSSVLISDSPAECYEAV